MTKGDDGTWQVTVKDLKPEYWTYNFVLDGVRILDPGNPYVLRDGTRFLSLLAIPGRGARSMNSPACLTEWFIRSGSLAHTGDGGAPHVRVHAGRL